jgi:ribosomal protein S18 acetylase RimI-like enzyme
MIAIAKANKNDNINTIIRLIYETDEYIYPSMCNHDYNLFEKIMQKILFIDNVFSYKNIIIASENEKIVGLLLYFDKDEKLPEVIDQYVQLNKGQSVNFDNVIKEYFGQLLSRMNRDSVYINNLCVDKKNRRRGIAAKLIHFLLEYFPNKKIVLDCLEENIEAVNFYNKLDFKITGCFPGFGGNQEKQVNCLQFEKSCL